MCGTALIYFLVIAVLAIVRAQRLELYEGDDCKRVAGVTWTCRKIKDCPKAQEDLQNGLRPETCGFSNDNQVVVCCKPTQTTPRPRPPTRPRPPAQTSPRPPTQTTPRPRPPTRPRPPPQTSLRPQPTTKKPKPTQSSQNQRPPQERGRKSKQMCKKYGESVIEKVEDEFGYIQTTNLCSLNLEPLITNGTQAEPREFPHMALIGYGKKNRIRWKCGGSLISERWVLSAAHCTLSGDDGPKWVRLGEFNVGSTEDEESKISRSEDFDIIQKVNHPQYTVKKNSVQINDIALYKLNRDVKFNEYVRPICLHTETQIPKRQGLITGWGRISYSERQSEILLKGNVTFLSGRQCKDSFKAIENVQREIRDNVMICAANFLTNTDTCQGDSGGPLQYILSDPYCMYSQVGITSFGIRCASNYPAVYTRVSYFVPWIESIVWP